MTTLYIRTTGSDSNDGLTAGAALATVQAAYNIASASGDYMLDVGAGTFAGVTLTADWPSRISVRGAGATSSFFGGINGDGSYTGDGPWVATPNYSITISSDQSINLGDVTSNSYTTAGTITLTNCVVSNVSAIGLVYGNLVGSGGTIILTNCVFSDASVCGGCSGGMGAGGTGTINVTNSVGQNLHVEGGGTADYYSAGGTLLMAGSNVGSVAFEGGNSGGFGDGIIRYAPWATLTYTGTNIVGGVTYVDGYSAAGSNPYGFAPIPDTSPYYGYWGSSGDQCSTDGTFSGLLSGWNLANVFYYEWFNYGYDTGPYNPSGYDAYGYDAYGYDYYGYNCYGFNSSGYNAAGAYAPDLVHPLNGWYAPSKPLSYSYAYFWESGFSTGNYDPNGLNIWGWPMDGYFNGDTFSINGGDDLENESPYSGLSPDNNFYIVDAAIALVALSVLTIPDPSTVMLGTTYTSANSRHTLTGTLRASDIIGAGLL